MKRIREITDVDLSYAELKGLESHFKKVRSDAVADSVRSTFKAPVEELRRTISNLKKTDKFSKHIPQQSDL